jgi:alpha-beta hydrolase superfamily lysophospholipase
MTDSTAPDTIVLIHGLWLTGKSWEHWVERYSNQGYTVIAKSWPGMDVDVSQLREDTSAIDELGVTEIADHYEKIITDLDRPPIIMGHSFGGLITQILLDRGHGACGVALDSAPFKGVQVLPPSTLRSGFPALKNPANRHRAVTLTPEEFHYAFTNTISDDASQELYDRYAVPGPGRVLFQAAFANFNPHAATKVDYHNDERPPLLIIAGGEDHVSPVSVNKSELKHQRRSDAITAFKVFPGRSHFLVSEEGWEEIADYALAWALDPTAGDEG